MQFEFASSETLEFEDTGLAVGQLINALHGSFFVLGINDSARSKFRFIHAGYGSVTHEAASIRRSRRQTGFLDGIIAFDENRVCSFD